ncbi:MAG: sugar ABC transporter ATP-binding protein, partial [Planctomycetota bacterium]
RDLQPSQLYICSEKLAQVTQSLREAAGASIDPVPVKQLGARTVLTDGHTRACAAFQEGHKSIPAYWETDELDWEAYEICVQWCRQEGIHSVADLPSRIVTADEYEELWYKRCRALHDRLAEQRKERGDATDRPGRPADRGPCAEDPGLLEMTGIRKAFGRHRVLDDVHFDLRAGEVHVLAGENGAGKSTLIKILGGVHRPDAGQILVASRPVRVRSPREATSVGVAIIHQELSLVPWLSVTDNIFLGREASRAGWLSRRRAQAQATRLLHQMGLDLDVRRLVGDLPISIQQMIEIAKALALDARIIVMDEPSSALSEPEVNRLFGRVSDLKARGCGIVYITHRLEEIFRLADRITVLRDGKKIVTAPASDLPAADLIRCMIGRDLAEHLPDRRHAPGSVRLAVEDCTVAAAEPGRPAVVSGVSFKVRAGEILGIGGLQGSGASDLLRALFGAHGSRASAGIEIDGHRVRIRSPRDAIGRGMALLTNDRQRTGLVPGLDVSANTTLASLARISPGGWMSRRRENHRAWESTRALQLRAVSLAQPVATLSGGNQQKVVLAKWLGTEPRIWLLDEPTRGVDVGAKREIYELMNEWSRQGHAIVLITSELPELLQMSDRIMVMHRGRVVGTFGRDEATAQRVLGAAMGDLQRD